MSVKIIRPNPATSIEVKSEGGSNNKLHLRREGNSLRITLNTGREGAVTIPYHDVETLIAGLKELCDV